MYIYIKYNVSQVSIHNNLKIYVLRCISLFFKNTYICITYSINKISIYTYTVYCIFCMYEYTSIDIKSMLSYLCHFDF